jgi:hypothetical protein
MITPDEARQIRDSKPEGWQPGHPGSDTMTPEELGDARPQDPVHGWLQLAVPRIGEDGQAELSWSDWREATGGEDLYAMKHRVFWMRPGSSGGGPYVRELPIREGHYLVRWVPAAVVLGIGELRMRRDWEQDPSDLSVTIVNANLKVLTPARHYPLNLKTDEYMNTPAHLSGQMHDHATEYARLYGYKLAGVWTCARDFTHRITAVPS